MGSNPNMHTFRIFYCTAGWHTALRQRNEDRRCGPLLAPPCAGGDCALAHASGVVAGLAQTFRPRRACDLEKEWTPSGHTRLLSASRLTVAPNNCMHSQQSGQQSATLLRSSSGSAGAGRQAVLTAVICFGLCASEEWEFAYILRSGTVAASSYRACNLTLPLVAACSCACSYAPSPRASQDNAIEYEGYERPALAKRTSRSCNL